MKSLNYYLVFTLVAILVIAGAAPGLARRNDFGRRATGAVFAAEQQQWRQTSGPGGGPVTALLSGLSAVTARIGGADAQTLYAGAQGSFAGLDQVNVRLARSLVGRGEVDVSLTVDGKPANTVIAQIR